MNNNWKDYAFKSVLQINNTIIELINTIALLK